MIIRQFTRLQSRCPFQTLATTAARCRRQYTTESPLPAHDAFQQSAVPLNSNPPPPPSSSPEPASSSAPQPPSNATTATTTTTTTPFPKLGPNIRSSISQKSGRVISAGLMSRTVRVEYRHLFFSKPINKTFPQKSTILVSDPNDSLRQGDVILFSNGWRKSKNVRHVVDKIVAPFGTPIEDRPPVLTREERDKLRNDKAVAKRQRKGRPETPRMGRIKRLVTERVQSMDQDEKMRLGLL